MELELIFESESPALVRRLRPMVGSLEQAEDLTQETMARALATAPRSAGEDQLRAWLHRVASNRAVDDLRRRARRRLEPLDAAVMTVASAVAPDDALAALEALERVRAADRLMRLLRFERGLAHGEIAAVLGISEAAARQRLRRARRAFADAFRALPLDRAPRVLVLMGADESAPYLRWLRRAGADARELRRAGFERDLATADAVVIGGSRTDVDPATYGDAPRSELIDPDPARDREDIAVIRAALEQDIPIVGICRGHQLLNIAFGGTLHQDLTEDRVATDRPDRHAIDSCSGSS